MMSRTTRAATLSLAAAMFVVAPSAAQEAGSRQTRDFVQAAAQSDQFEILAADSVLAGSRDPEVRSFAQEMIRDHGGTTATLKATVAQAGLEQPAPGIAGDQAMFLAALQSERGGELDKVYVRQQVLAHRAALAVMLVYSRSGYDPMLRKVAASEAKLIEFHERTAERIAARLGSP